MLASECRAWVKYDAFTSLLRALHVDVAKGAELWAAVVYTVRMGDVLWTPPLVIVGHRWIIAKLKG